MAHIIIEYSANLRGHFDLDGFLKAVHDNAPVTLKFHFWSGATVTYHVTKSGSSVTGTAS